jgi:ABC-type transporter Mla subunit MlaD
MTELIPALVGIVLAFFLVMFLWRFVRPFLRMQKKIQQATDLLEARFQAAGTAGMQVIDLKKIEDEFSFDENLAHLWQEFRHTLHAETSDTVDEYGQRPVARYRQTVPAEVFFSTRSMIDVPLSTEFFRHLPGVLTGLGIIGTFAGLIHGLAAFDISGNPDKVNAGVQELVASVRGAFIISAIAIFLAIVITAAEKFMLTRLQGQVQRLQHTIDKMFDAGAGEDYLSTIAARSEQSATHLAHLKEGLVNDLKHVLEDFAERQSNAMMDAAKYVATNVNQSLEAPLEKMNMTLERSLDGQQQAVQRLLDGSLERFATHLEEIVGAKLNDAAGSVADAAASMREAMADIPAQIEDAVARVRAVLEDVAQSAQPIAENADRMAKASEQLADSVAQSADTLDYALTRLKQVGDALSATLEKTGELAESIRDASGRAQTVVTSIQAAGAQFDAAAGRFNVAAESLSALAANTERDAEAQQRLIESVERAANQLSAAQRDVDAFLQGIAGALTDTHEAFSREINSTLDRTHETFHHNLANATTLLAGTVHQFSEFLDTEFKDSVENLQREFARLSASGNGGAPA